MGVEAKICGITRPDDAAHAVRHGASRLGVIFAGGPRLVTVAQARDIVAAAGGIPVFGVFGPGPLATMLDTASAAGLDGIQLYGGHDPADAAPLRAQGFEVWRVLPLAESMNLERAIPTAADGVDAVLVEAAIPGGAGGRGVALPLELARAARRAASGVRFVLAGGLTPQSVDQAIRVVGPDVVDVSSGVESSPGIKDRALVAQFLENVLAARSAA